MKCSRIIFAIIIGSGVLFLLGCDNGGGSSSEDIRAGFFEQNTYLPINAVVMRLEKEYYDMVDIQIYISGISMAPIVDVEFSVSFDPEIVRYLAGEEKDFLRSSGPTTAVFEQRSGSEEGLDDSVHVRITRVDNDGGASGDGTLCLLTFKILKKSKADLYFTDQHIRVYYDGGRVELTGIAWYGGTVVGE